MLKSWLSFSVLVFMHTLFCGLTVARISLPHPDKNPVKPRLLILTDMNSLKPHFLEADDAQSMIRLLLYSNEFNLEGFVVSSKMAKGLPQQPQLVHEIIDAYEKVRPNLLKHDLRYPPAGELHKLVKTGQANPVPTGRDPLISFGEGKDTEGSDWIIKVVDKPAQEPVWISIWGGAADLAQALWKVKQTRSEAAVHKFIQKLRVRAITDQDSTGQWILKNFPGIWYLRDNYSYRGMYKGGNHKIIDSLWVAHNIKQPGNALGLLYPNYYYGPRSIIRGIKEGDSPSYLSIIPNGLNIAGMPGLGGWGGIFKKQKNSYYTDSDTVITAAVRINYQANVYEWRTHVQDDFKARLEWCTKPYNKANHAPVVAVNGNWSQSPLNIEAAPGRTVKLSAAGSGDPDGNSLSFRWCVYPGALPDFVTLTGTDEQELAIHINKGASQIILPVLLTVTDSGEPALHTYKRVLLKIKSPSS